MTGAQRESTGVTVQDLTSFGRRLAAGAQRCNLELRILGHMGIHPLWFLTPRMPNPVLANVLVAGGFHGEEPAGSLGILAFLEASPFTLLQTVNLSLLPLVNPTGFAAGRRLNDWGENPNSGFVATASGEASPSAEGRILLENMNLLRDAARSGFVSLHEDEDFEEFYLYTFERGKEPGAFTKMLVAAEARHFAPTREAFIDGAAVQGGIIFNHPDGSFEHRLFEEGIPATACTETPGRVTLDRRVEANRGITEAFCNYFACLTR